MLLCGRYEGVDERLLQAEVDEEISIGDYVLSGGELAAAVLVDAVARLQEGALNDAEGAEPATLYAAQIEDWRRETTGRSVATTGTEQA